MGDGEPPNKGLEPDPDVHISLDDQKKINQFARCNAKYFEIKTDLAAKQNEMKNLEDASEELILYDETDGSTIPFLQGEAFMCLNLKDTNKALERTKSKLADNIRELEEILEELKQTMSTLKTQLYAKFGNQINLEEDD